jgi:hypothetical protein
MGHGFKDLDPQEQEKLLKDLADAKAKVGQVVSGALHPSINPLPKMQIVRVAGDDYLARGYREAIKKELEANGHYGPVLQRIERFATDIANGFRLKDRLNGEGRTPDDIVIQSENNQ